MSEPIDLGTWIKGDELSKFTVKITTRDENDVRSVYPITDVAPGGITFELRSLDSPGTGPISKAFTVVDVPTAEVSIANFGSAWTPPTGHTEERFEAFIKVVRPIGPGWAREHYLLTLRTAP